MDLSFSDAVSDRMKQAVYVAWRIFSRQVGHGVYEINKEASMQLKFALLLERMLPLIQLWPDEQFTVVLEKGILTNGRLREVDLLFTGQRDNDVYRIVVEMKCYRKTAASGNPRGAHDIFMKDVYVDLELLESYVRQGSADHGIAIVLNDLKRFVNPERRTGKCWDYDTSDGHRVEPGTWTTPIGGKEIEITLRNAYEFRWKQFGDFYFLINEAVPST